MKWLESIPVNREPVTAENGAVQAYVTLLVAEQMRQDGMGMVAGALEQAAAELVRRHGRLPPRTYIPPSVLETVSRSVVAAAKAGSEDAMRAALTSPTNKA